MSVFAAGQESPRFGSFSWWGSRSRVSWGAVFAGAVVAVATWLLLGLLGAAFGLGSVRDLGTATNEAAAPGVGVGIWTIIALALSMALGGYVASRFSGTHSHLDGELHGITVWAVASLFGLLALAHVAGSLLGSIGFDIGPAIGSAATQVGQMTGTVTPEINPQRFVDRLEQSLGGNGDPTTMSREQIASEIRTLVGDVLPNRSLSDADRTRLIALVAADYGVTKDEATRRVAAMESDAKARIADVQQKVRAVADQVAQDAVTASRALFTALVLGLLASLVGAWLGTRHKRILHPHETVVPATAPGALHEPMSVSVYDDMGHLVSQYLGRVSFPASKQDLLRFARTSNVSPGVLHSIEGLSDRNFASANEVLASIGALR